MLFPYIYVNNTMEKMQEFIDYIFINVWCKANTLDYKNAFADNEELYSIIMEYHYLEDENIPKGILFFIKGIQVIYNLFKELDHKDVLKLKSMYEVSNDIENICSNTATYIPATYQDIQQIDKKLSDEFEKFYKNLYNHNFLSLKIIADKIGSIGNHYKEFIKINNIGKCPFCGIHLMDNEYDKTREAYDHYLPKHMYPFSTINMYNLAPSCHKCNSGYKLMRSPILNEHNNKQKAFYPYSSDQWEIDINISITLDNLCDYSNLKPENIYIDFYQGNIGEELESWDRTYSVKNRYKSRYCDKTEVKSWLSFILDEGENYRVTSSDMLKKELKKAANNRYGESNLLKKPFLEACDSNGLF